MQRKISRERYSDLRQILENRRKEIWEELVRKRRDLRLTAMEQRERGRQDEVESVDDNLEQDIQYSLFQMKSETLEKIDEALVRLEDGVYGWCFECGDEISERRLRALPFAVRCRDCQEDAEMRDEWERERAARRNRYPRLLEAVA